jgi:hypothetical protein
VFNSTTTCSRRSAPSLGGAVRTQELANEAFADPLKKHRQPVGLMASLKDSVGEGRKSRAKK